MTSPNPKVAAVPKGFRSITPIITVSDVTAAIDYYSRAFGATVVEKLTTPGTETVFHAILKIGDTRLLLMLDAPVPGNHGSVALHHYLEDLEAVFEASVQAGAIPLSPITETWWGDRQASVVDPFGVRWTLARRVERLSADERAERLDAAFAGTAVVVPGGPVVSEAEAPTPEDLSLPADS